VYNGSQGYIVGIEFKLSKMFAKPEFEVAGANYYKVLNGSQCLTDSQIDIIYDLDMLRGILLCVKLWTTVEPLYIKLLICREQFITASMFEEGNKDITRFRC